jgi:hypothetical protein
VEYRFPAAPGNAGVLIPAPRPRAVYSMFPQSIPVEVRRLVLAPLRPQEDSDHADDVLRGSSLRGIPGAPTDLSPVTLGGVLLAVVTGFVRIRVLPTRQTT